MNISPNLTNGHVPLPIGADVLASVWAASLFLILQWQPIFGGL